MRRVKFRPAVFVVLFGTFTVSAWARDAWITIEAGGRQREYLLHLPALSKGRPVPLLLVFHGGGSRAETMPRFTGLDQLADHESIAVAYLQGIDRHWNDGRVTTRRPDVDDVAFAARVIENVGARVPLDSRRIGATGISNGAMFVERLGCELSDRVTAIAAVAGSMAADLRGTCRPARRVAVLQINGTDDPIVPYRGGAVKSFGGRGPGGLVLSVTDTMAFWSAVDGCKAMGKEIQLQPRAVFDRTRVVFRRAQGCSATVEQYRIDGGGHTWPGGPQYLPRFVVGVASRQLDASRTIVRFVLDHPRER